MTIVKDTINTSFFSLNMSQKTFINGKQKSSMEIDPGMRFKYFSLTFQS